MPELEKQILRDEKHLLKDGQRFGGYRILRRLGGGGMGEVYEAWHESTQRRVAVKLLLGAIDSPAARERFLREGRLAASLNHRNAVYVFGTEEIGGHPVIVMELVRSRTLQQVVQQRGPLPPPQAVGAILQVIAGLEAALALGILHCDVKPANCFIDADGMIKVGDFGLSVTSRTASAGGVAPVASGGTPGYAAPEQVRGEPLDLRADLYSVGFTLLFLLTAQLPFGSGDRSEIFARVLKEPPPSRAVLGRRMPALLAGIVARCLAKDPADRFQSYAALRKALLVFLHGWSGRPRNIVAHLVGLSVTVTLLLVALLNQISREPTVVPVSDFGLQFPNARGPEAVTREPADFERKSLRFSPLGLDAGLVAMLALQVICLRGGWAALRLKIFYVNLSLAVHQPLSFRWGKARPIRTPQVVAPPPLRSREAFGPYQVIGTLGDEPSNGFLLGYDAALQRQVWLRVRPPGAGPPPRSANDLRRSARVRLLASARGSDGGWDAYEAIPGQPLAVIARAPQSWREVRVWLLALGRELAVARLDGSVPHRLEPDQVWIGESGMPVLLDFPAPGLPAASASEDSGPPWPPRALQLFVKRVALFALEARSVSADDAAQRGPEVPLPAHARSFLDSLGRYESVAGAIQALGGLMNRPTEVRRTSRLGAAILGGSLTGFGALVVLLFYEDNRGLLVAVGGFALALAIVVLTRSNPWLESARLRVVTGKGARLSRWRHALRTTLTLVPLLALIFAVKLHLPVLPAVVGTLILIGLVWIIVCPQQGLHDRLAGTCVIVNE